MFSQRSSNILKCQSKQDALNDSLGTSLIVTECGNVLMKKVRKKSLK